MMKKLSNIVLLFFSFVALFGLLACHRHTLTDENGQAVDLNHHPNRWLVINYWAPWCAPCKKELPEVNHFYLAHHTQVEVYGVDFDHPDAEKLKTLAKQMQLNYPLLVEDPAIDLHLQDIQGLPVTFVFNPEGQLVNTLVGPQTKKSLEAAIHTGK